MVHRHLVPPTVQNVLLSQSEDLLITTRHARHDLTRSNRMDQTKNSDPRTLFDRCLSRGEFPVLWKEGQIVLLPKPGRSPDSPSAFRSVCLAVPAVWTSLASYWRGLWLPDSSRICPDVIPGYTTASLASGRDSLRPILLAIPDQPIDRSLIKLPRNLRLADPDFHKSRPIEVLLSA
jgi:hypothetical protein